MNIKSREQTLKTDRDFELARREYTNICRQADGCCANCRFTNGFRCWSEFLKEVIEVYPKWPHF